MLLLNLGGPETLADVQPFLYNLFKDDSIIRLPPYGENSSLPVQWGPQEGSVVLYLDLERLVSQ